MKPTICILILLFSVLCSGIGQERIVVKAGTAPREYFKPEEIYKYSKFLPGTVYFKNGEVANAPLNYCILSGEMHFIKRGRDTLAISNPNDIKLATVNTDTFIFDKGYLQLIAGNSSKTLAKKQYVKMEDIRKGDAYGMTSSLSATTNYSTYSASSSISYKLVVQQEMILSKRTEFYLGDSKGDYKLLIEKSVLKMYPSHKEEIKNFIKTNGTDFRKQEDVMKLFAFIESF